MASRIADALGCSADISIAGGRQPRTRVLAVLPDLDGGGAQRVTLRLLRCLDMQRYDVTLLVLDGPVSCRATFPAACACFMLHSTAGFGSARWPRCGMRATPTY